MAPARSDESTGARANTCVSPSNACTKISARPGALSSVGFSDLVLGRPGLVFIQVSLKKSWTADVISKSVAPLFGPLMGSIQKERPHA